MAVRRLVAVCVALVGLAACSDDSDAGPKEPESSPAVSSTPTASPTASPPGPSIPPEAQGIDEASAKAFVRFWFATLSESMRTGDVELVRSLGTPDCRSCNAVISKIEKLYAKGGHVRTEGWVVERFLPDSNANPRRAEFKLRTRYLPQVLYGENNQIVSRTPEDLIPFEMALVRHAEEWRVQAAVILR